VFLFHFPLRALFCFLFSRLVSTQRVVCSFGRRARPSAVARARLVVGKTDVFFDRSSLVSSQLTRFGFVLSSLLFCVCFLIMTPLCHVICVSRAFPPVGIGGAACALSRRCRATHCAIRERNANTRRRRCLVIVASFSSSTATRCMCLTTRRSKRLLTRETKRFPMRSRFSIQHRRRQLIHTSIVFDSVFPCSRSEEIYVVLSTLFAVVPLV
jgi:hypothetical protein